MCACFWERLWAAQPLHVINDASNPVTFLTTGAISGQHSESVLSGLKQCTMAQRNQCARTHLLRGA